VRPMARVTGRPLSAQHQKLLHSSQSTGLTSYAASARTGGAVDDAHGQSKPGSAMTSFPRRGGIRWECSSVWGRLASGQCRWRYAVDRQPSRQLADRFAQLPREGSR